jgi:hypothetical protein
MLGALVRTKSAEFGETLPWTLRVLGALTGLGLLVSVPWALLTDSGCRRHDSPKGVALAQMSNFGGAIQLYSLDRRSLPRSLDQLTQSDENGNAYIEKIPSDPWGQPYVYRVLDAARQRYEIRSEGEDRELATDDDLIWPPEDPDTRATQR